jgi:hypothetical protein
VNSVFSSLDNTLVLWSAKPRSKRLPPQPHRGAYSGRPLRWQELVVVSTRRIAVWFATGISVLASWLFLAWHFSSANAGRLDRETSVDGRPASIIGVGVDSEVVVKDSGLLPRVPDAIEDSPVSAELAQLVTECRLVIEAYRGIEALATAPVWVRLHALGIYDPLVAGDVQSGIYRQRLLQSIVEPPANLVPPFVLKAKVPYSQKEGREFEKEYHRNQFLHLLSVGEVPLATLFKAGDSTFTLADILEQSLYSCRSDEELIKTVSAFSFYLPKNKAWKNKFGERLTLGALASSLLTQKSEYCFGTHRLYALACVIKRFREFRERDIEPFVPQIERCLSDELRKLRIAQMESGFILVPTSTEKRSLFDTLDHQVRFNGHSLEWIAVYSNAAGIQEPWVCALVAALVRSLSLQVDSLSSSREQFDTADYYRLGPLCHAVHAIHLWSNRVQVSGP